MRNRPLIRVTVVLLLTATSCLFAQQQQPEGAGALSSRAYKLAQSATTLEELTESLRLCGQAMKANPSAKQKTYIEQLAGWTYNKRGEVLVKLAEKTAKVDPTRSTQYEAAAGKDFDLSVRFDETRWKPHFNRAVSEAMNGNYEVALQDLDFVLRKQPDHKNALFNRAEILLQLGQFDRAINDYAAVIKLDPKDGAAYAGRGIALAATGDTQNAMLDLNSVIRLKPNNAASYVDRADLYAALGEFERAAGDYKVAIKLDSESARAYQNVAWLMATCPVERFRNPELAVQAAKKAIELDGQTYLGLDTYAAALAAAGQFDQAVTVQQKALQVAPVNEQVALQERMARYQRRQPFVEEQSVGGNVRLATAEEDLK